MECPRIEILHCLLFNGGRQTVVSEGIRVERLANSQSPQRQSVGGHNFKASEERWAICLQYYLTVNDTREV
jgi:hypothetical protein